MPDTAIAHEDPDDPYQLCLGCGDRVLGLTFGLCNRCLRDNDPKPDPDDEDSDETDDWGDEA